MRAGLTKPMSARRRLKACTNQALTSFITRPAQRNGRLHRSEKSEKEDPKRNVWVIGVDKDQYAEGQVKGTKDNVTLTSMVKKWILPWRT